MCRHPILIPNPNRGLSGGLNFLKDTTSQFIEVPCGHCDECIAVKQMYLVQRVQMESLDSHIFFSTLTYNDEWLPYVDTSSGYRLKFADIRHFQLLFKRIRNGNLFGRPFRYFLVTERGTKKGRPHAHCLWLLPRYSSDDYNTISNLEQLLWNVVLDNWVINVGSNRSPDYRPLCTYVSKFIGGKLRSNYDLHYLNPSLTSGGVSECAFYVLKYMLKTSSREEKLQQALRLNLSDEEYNITWNLVKSRHVSSKGFGLGIYDNFQSYSIVKYIRDCIAKSPKDSPFPFYFSPFNGSSFPLAPYYKNKGFLFDFKTAFDFLMRQHDNYKERISYNDYLNTLDAFYKIQSQVDLHDSSDYLQLIYE